MKSRILLLIYVLIYAFASAPFHASAAALKVDIVLCMDLSGSTNGLLANFRERYWEVINQADRFETPIQLRIGFISYSRPSNGKENNYVKVIHDLTDDFDALAQDVFTIKTITEHGDQFVGAAISAALNEMTWSKEKDALKLIYAIGNGSAYMGGNEFIKACDKAVSNNIIVNTIFCKTYVNPKDMSQWKDIAGRTGGVYDEIDINKRLPKMASSKAFEMLVDMNSSLNNTFVPYGPKGESRNKFLLDADRFMLETGEGPFCERANAKATSQFLEKNDAWDLVDLSLNRKIIWASLDTSLLIVQLRKATDAERDQYISQKWQERRTLIANIRPVYRSWKRDREEWIVDMKITEANTLGKAIIFAFTKALEKRGVKPKGI